MNRLLAFAIVSLAAAPVAALAQTTAGEPAAAGAAPAAAGGDAAPGAPQAAPAAPAAEAHAAPAAPAAEEPAFIVSEPPDALFSSDLVGEAVYGSAAEKIGDINDLLISPGGAVTGVVIGIGGFLGVGEKDVAVPLGALSMQRVDNRVEITIDATEAELAAAPGFVRADGTTSDRLGAFTRAYERTRAEAEAALGVAGERAGELAGQAGEQAGVLYEQAEERARELYLEGLQRLERLAGEGEGEPAPAPAPADGAPAEPAPADGGGTN